MKKTQRIIHIGLHAPEVRIIELMEEEGHMVSEVLRALIRQYGAENYPRERAYAKAMLVRAEVAKKKVETDEEIAAMTNEEYATKVLRGKIVGLKVEFRIANGQPVRFALDTIKTHSLENNEMIKIHNQLLDRTFTYLGDQEPTEEQYKEIWKGW